MSPLASLFERGNEVLNINNADGADFHITTHGSDWLWSVFSIFALVTLLVLGFSFTKPKNQRTFLHVIALGLIALSYQYFTLASNLGWAPVHAEFNHVTTSDQSKTPGMRQIFYARWVSYFVAFPTFFLSFAVLVGETWSNTIAIIICEELTVVSLLIGTLIHSTYKWGYYTFGLAGFFLVVYYLVFSYRVAAQSQDKSVATHSFAIIGGAIVLLMLYPIAWALSEGGNVIQPDSEAVFYGILDIVFFILIGTFYQIFVSRSIDFVGEGVSGFDYRVFTSHGPRSVPAVAYPSTKEEELPTPPAQSRPSEATAHTAEPTSADVEQQV
ncbi:uncharacterized protein SAPINGB_P002160 [Magnusiomyces paraingens]|uniref:Uncharacterized protein n=1 Tax=Magnusiomyces paraingens TaxID=2606893 RepID=A0A5E8BKG3_9ASCO|nr:uncharacterized protein SAPINGB_P002160 [Saprochaete ingens]VVT49216.1 unnamed protein product [Saprochaete ingens]